MNGYIPQNTVIFVERSRITTLSKNEILPATVGFKAYGILCLKSGWTKPLIVISKNMFTDHFKYRNEGIVYNYDQWVDKIADAISVSQINIKHGIILRSSGLKERLSERGLFCSKNTKYEDIKKDLTLYLDSLCDIDGVWGHEIAIIAQELVEPIAQKGHLSNERALSQHTRDWIIEEETSFQPATKLALRKWREPIEPDTYEVLALEKAGKVIDGLKIPAFWAHALKKRIHYEWVSDSTRVYIVQADEEDSDLGDAPAILNDLTSYHQTTYIPSILKKPTEFHYKNYPKIKNTSIYAMIGYSFPNIFILDDLNVLNNLSLGNIDPRLEEDINNIAKHELVVRMDIITEDQAERQMLPRANFRDAKSTLDWIKEKASLHSDFFAKNPVFILHNFIPAKSSVFAFAKPNKRRVLIESLWGLPEGLYYFSHDKYSIDTLSADINEAKKLQRKYVIKEDIKFKSLFVFPDSTDGNWKTRHMAPRYGWHRCISDRSTLQYIAIKSREIADIVGKGISIMWFVGIDEQHFGVKALPWHHESIPFGVEFSRPYELKLSSDKIISISSLADLERLEEMADLRPQDIRIIKIVPREDALLRNREAITRIGNVAVKLGAVIRLEGGVLSHALYQLKRTKAHVEVRNPFFDDDRPEYNKLVRDKIPENILSRGEEIEVAYYSNTDLTRLLKDKLLEEAFEIHLSGNIEEMCEELADIQEVIDALIKHINRSKDDISLLQERKRTKAGGFESGVVLLKTHNPPPVSFDENKLLETKAVKTVDITIDELYKRSMRPKVVKDKRRGANELLFDLRVPLLNESWEVAISEDVLTQLAGKKVYIKGIREGAHQKVRVIATPKETQGKLI
ncbi:nucleoside triphosphate pyrophosphohydrolase [Desulfovibrio sp. OttesenSCG-928-A18]|nr:nucleoside triphosphate pyrophosphohydrolase [Desulfovibrio sp. OttesenSCG-928-A18]